MTSPINAANVALSQIAESPENPQRRFLNLVHSKRLYFDTLCIKHDAATDPKTKSNLEYQLKLLINEIQLLEMCYQFAKKAIRENETAKKSNKVNNFISYNTLSVETDQSHKWRYLYEKEVEKTTKLTNLLKGDGNSEKRISDMLSYRNKAEYNECVRIASKMQLEQNHPELF